MRHLLPVAPRRLPIAALVCLAACGEAPQEPAPPSPREASAPSGDQAAADKLRALESLGYLGAETEREDEGGVLRHDPERAWPGLNLYVSGHAASAVLMDMQGRVLHRWARPFEATFPDAPPDPEADRRGRHHWRRAYLQPNGDLIAIHEGQGLVRIDLASELVWRSPRRAHHAAQLVPGPDGDELWVLSRKAHTTGYLGAPRAVAEDFVSVVDPATGELLRETSVLRALLRSPFRSIAEASPKLEGDVFHTNSLEVLDGRFADRHPAFSAGSVLLSSRVLHAIFVLDPRAADGKGEVTWAQRGTWRSQHEPHLLEDGRILLFDNAGAEPHSRVLELPITPPDQPPEETVVYAGTEDERFYTKFCGAAARLPNGNTLITETGPGRVFEVTPAGNGGGEIVWEYLNPEGDEHGRVASIFELVRLPADSVSGWLGR